MRKGEWSSTLGGDHVHCSPHRRDVVVAVSESEESKTGNGGSHSTRCAGVMAGLIPKEDWRSNEKTGSPVEES